MPRGADPKLLLRCCAPVLAAAALAVRAQDAPVGSAPPPAPEPAPSSEARAEPENSAPPPEEPDEAPVELPSAVVYLNTGQKLTGTLIERDDDHLVLSVGNIKMDLPMAQVDRVEVQATVSEQYEAMRRVIPPKDLPQRLLLAKWLLDKERYEWARDEVEGVLDEDPANPEALALRRLIVNQLELHTKSGQPGAEPRPRQARPPKFQFPLLTPEQINLIKIYEVDLSDPPRMVVPRQAIDRLLQQYAGSDLLPPTKEGKDALYHRSPAEVLELMFRLRARELYGMITVQDQPRSMLRFREDVQQSWLINSCATDRCHGGAEAGRLRLYNRRPNSDATVYTDFLILDRFRLQDDRPLIDYEEPAHSPLLQMALPREDSLFPHPKVPAANGRGDIWKPAIPSTTDPRFSRALDWMKSMYKPRPEYPVAYEPPGSSVPRADAAPMPEPR